MTPELALQKAVRIRLTSEPNVIALIPAASILDRNERPAPSPSIVIGEGQSIDENDSFKRRLTRCYLDLHVWKEEPSTAGVKAIAGAIRAAIRQRRMVADTPFHIAGCYVQSIRFMRDPDGETSHAVVTINAKVQEL